MSRLLSDGPFLPSEWERYVRNLRGRLERQKQREVLRARAAEALLREAERLLRSDPNMQQWRKRAGEHLANYRDYEPRPSLVVTGFDSEAERGDG